MASYWISGSFSRAACPPELFLDRSRIGYVRERNTDALPLGSRQEQLCYIKIFYTRFACMRAY